MRHASRLSGVMVSVLLAAVVACAGEAAYQFSKPLPPPALPSIKQVGNLETAVNALSRADTQKSASRVIDSSHEITRRLYQSITAVR